MHVCKHGCDVLDLCIFQGEKSCKSNYSQELCFPVYKASSKHLRVEKFPKVTQTFNTGQVFITVLNYPNPLSSQIGLCEHGNT